MNEDISDVQRCSSQPAASKNNNKKRSYAWKHFKEYTNNKVECSICKETLDYENTTSTLIYHLKKHKIPGRQDN